MSSVDIPVVLSDPKPFIVNYTTPVENNKAENSDKNFEKFCIFMLLVIIAGLLLILMSKSKINIATNEPKPIKSKTLEEAVLDTNSNDFYRILKDLSS